MLTLAATASPRAGAARAAAALAIPLGGALLLLPFATAGARLAGFALFALVALVAWERIGRSYPHAQFGAANAITLARAAGTALLAALALEPRLLAGGVGWIVAAGVGCLLALDGLDGWFARRQGLASDFGARFDLEVDALLILVLAALAFALGKVGSWVFGIGLLRYAFLLAGRLVPALRGELPPSRRRQAVCVLQIGALGLLLVPGVGPPVSGAIAAGALAALLWSFAVDVRWLLRNGT